ncbi:MAG: pyridoxal phosphate-dependent aminotransferase [Sphaerochaetaceae bacterium]
MNFKDPKNLFSDEAVNLAALKRKAYNFRWAEVEEGVIPLTAADPDFPVAPEIVQALTDYVKDGYFSYTPHTGMPEFKQSIARYLNQKKQEQVEPELVLPIDSAARGMYIIAKTVLKPGDEVIIFDPVDYLFRESTLAAKAQPVLFPAVVTDDERLDLSKLESYITEKTRMICLCNPHNPLGLVYSKEDLVFLLELANKYDLWIMNDEIWSDIVYKERPFVSILSFGKEMNKKTLSVFGFSKSFGIAGLRAGCLYAQDEAIFKDLLEMAEVHTTAGGITSLSQIAGMTCLDSCGYWVDAFLEHLGTNRDYAYHRINAMPKMSCRRPQATYLMFIDIRQTGLDSETFVTRLREEAKLAVVPGTPRFFGPGAEGYVRMCIATSKGILEEGLNRLQMWLETNFS